MTTLDDIFDSPTAKVLDFYLGAKGKPFTISMISEKIGLSFKTTSKAIKKLEGLNLIHQTGRMKSSDGMATATARAFKLDQGSNTLTELQLIIFHLRADRR